MSGVDIDSVADTAPGPDAYVFPAPAGGPLRATGFRDRVWRGRPPSPLAMRAGLVGSGAVVGGVGWWVEGLDGEVCRPWKLWMRCRPGCGSSGPAGAGDAAVAVRWAVVVDGRLPAGLVTNAAACLGAAVAALVPAVIGDSARDASGTSHPGLPGLGCTILRGDGDTVRAVHSKALGDPEVLVADMAAVAQRVRVYADYLAKVRDASEEQLAYYAVSVLGPRKAIDRLVGSLPLLR